MRADNASFLISATSRARARAAPIRTRTRPDKKTARPPADCTFLITRALFLPLSFGLFRFAWISDRANILFGRERGQNSPANRIPATCYHLGGLRAPPTCSTPRELFYSVIYQPINSCQILLSLLLPISNLLSSRFPPCLSSSFFLLNYRNLAHSVSSVFTLSTSN